MLFSLVFIGCDVMQYNKTTVWRFTCFTLFSIVEVSKVFVLCVYMYRNTPKINRKAFRVVEVARRSDRLNSPPLLTWVCGLVKFILLIN